MQKGKRVQVMSILVRPVRVNLASDILRHSSALFCDILLILRYSPTCVRYAGAFYLCGFWREDHAKCVSLRRMREGWQLCGMSEDGGNNDVSVSDNENGLSGKGKKRRSFTYATKYAVRDAFNNGNVTISELSRRYKVDRKNVRRWINVENENLPYYKQKIARKKGA